ncbi:MAG TPA: hypothetical protein VGK20_10830 [Candidatus Binatia bacterium]|jgi:hypothetical protein
MGRFRIRRNTAVAVFVVTLLSLPGPVLAQKDPLEACDAATRARLVFLESRLDAVRPHERWWWEGWMTVFVIGTAFEAVQGATSRDHGAQADEYLGAIESVAGIADLLFDDRVALRGAQASSSMPAQNGEQCAKRLEVAEKELAAAAEQAQDRYGWSEHLINLAVSGGHTAIVAGAFGDRTRGATSFAVNEVVSELQVWTEPSRPIGDWNDYRSTFGEARTASAKREQWQWIAGPTGLGVRYSF